MNLTRQVAWLAREVGDWLMAERDQAPPQAVHDKGKNDFVTEFDRAAQDKLLEGLERMEPGIAFLSEEGVGERKPVDGLCWVIDPIDGTTNFIHDLPMWGISIALVDSGHPILGVVAHPHRQEIFSAREGEGAFMNHQPIRVSEISELGRALTATGFPFKRQERVEEYLVRFRSVLKATAGIRRMGSAALDLAYLACGRYDLFWELGLAPWDMAAGAVLVREAGGVMAGLDGEEGDDFLWHGDVAAANGGLLEPFLGFLNQVNHEQ